MFNKIANYFGLQTGQEPQAAFRALQEIVGAEIVKAVAGAQSGQAERDATRQALNMNWSPEQFAKTKKTVEDALAAQLIGSHGVVEALRNGVSEKQYQSIVGPAQYAKLKAVSEHLPAKPAPTGGGGGGGGWAKDPATGNWKGPDGRVYDPNGKPLQ